MLQGRFQAIHRWLNLDPFWIGVSAFVALAIGLLNFSAEYAFAQSYAIGFPVPRRLFDELSGTLDLLLLLPFLLKFFSLLPLTRATWIQRIPLYLLAMIVFGILHTTLMVLIRTPLYPLFGFGSYDPGELPYRAAMETAKVSPAFWVVYIAQMFHRRHREHQERQLNLAQLELELESARLTLLRSQLNPHFLFNSFNLISSVLHENADTADKLLSDLGEFLRYSLRFGEAQEVAVSEELNHVQRYLEIMQVRFGDRLRVRLDIDPATMKRRMPVFVLQPLVENAIKYALDEQGEVEISLRLREVDGTLDVRVRDNGPGVDEMASGAGLGLANIRARLSALYGDSATLKLSNHPKGGAEVEMRLPSRDAAPTTFSAGS